jgi:hypothetical protein
MANLDYYWITYREKFGNSHHWQERCCLWQGNPFRFAALGEPQEKIWGDSAPMDGTPNKKNRRQCMIAWHKMTEEELDLYEQAYDVKLSDRRKRGGRKEEGEDGELQDLLRVINGATGKRFTAITPEMRKVRKKHGLSKMKLVVWSLTDKRSPVNWRDETMRGHLVPTTIFRHTKFQAKLEKAEAAWLDVFRLPHPEKR